MEKKSRAQAPQIAFFLLLQVVVLSMFSLLITHTVFAAPLEEVSDRLARLNESTDSSHIFRFVSIAGIGAGETIVIDFPAGIFDFGVAYDFNDIELYEGSSGDCESATFSPETIGASPSGATWGAVLAGDTITITSGTGTIPASRCVQVILESNGGTHALTNPAVTSNTVYQFEITAATEVGYTAVVILNDTTTPDSDQVEIHAQLQPSLSLDVDVATTNCNNNTETSYPNNIVNFGSLVPGTPKSSNATINFICIDTGTNAGNGITVFVRSARANAAGGLVHQNSVNFIASATANLNSGGVGSGYGIRVASTGTPTFGSFSASSPFNSVTTADVGLIPGTGAAAASLVTATAAAQTGTSSRIAVEVSAKAAADTASGNYTDTLTFTAVATY